MLIQNFDDAVAAMADRFPLIHGWFTTARDLDQSDADLVLLTNTAVELYMSQVALGDAIKALTAAYEQGHSVTNKLEQIIETEARAKVSILKAMALEYSLRKGFEQAAAAAKIRETCVDNVIHTHLARSTSPVANASSAAEVEAWQSAARVAVAGAPVRY